MILAGGDLGAARWAFTDRLGGVSSRPFAELNVATHVGDDPAAVCENRRLVLGALPGATALAFCDQVHGAEVAVVTGGPEAGHDRGAGTATAAPTADAQVTTVAGVALAVLTADCVPVLLASRRGQPAVGVAHAGRLGVQRGVVTAAVASLTERRVRPGDLGALVGPAVCAGCYEVPATMRHEVAVGLPVAAATTAVGTPSLDLPAAVISQLREAGVGTVDREETCTAESERLYSHRRDGVTGRQAGVVWLPA